MAVCRSRSPGHRRARGRQPVPAVSDRAVTLLVVDHRDRLARVGVECPHAARSVSGRRSVVLESGDSVGALVRAARNGEARALVVVSGGRV